MKTRIISAAILFIILVPLIILGGIAFDLAIYLISLFALKEFLDVKEKKKKIPLFIKIISYVMLIIIILGINTMGKTIYTIDFRLLVALFMVMLISVILYHDMEKYSINDAFYLIGSLLFLGFAFAAIMYLRRIGLNHLLYVVLVATITDAYAYFGGYFIGRHKLIEISPKKTVEGTIVGTLFCVFVGGIFYYNYINSSISIMIIILMTLLLSFAGQFADLVFSAIKRYFETKDFSNLIPGHGGILDRLDSIIFVLLSYMFFITI